MSNGKSRRNFLKGALATPLLSAGMFAESSVPKADPPPSRHDAQSKRHEGLEEIEFPRVYTGNRLARISCPLGGIGTGGIGLGGRGNLQDWQIFNRPEIGNALEYAFPSLWIQSSGGDPYSVVLERRLLPPYDLHEEGLGFGNVPGLPRMAEAQFFSSFPISRIVFEDRECPVNVSLETFSPFQPLDADASGLPCAVLSYEVHNPAMTAVEAVVAWSLSNPVGTSEHRRNDRRTDDGIDGLFMTDPSLDADDPLCGSFALAALVPEDGSNEVLTAWKGGSDWQVGAYSFWFDTFARTGNLGTAQEPSTPVGSVAIRYSIPAGEKRSFRFLLAWHFPNRTPDRCGWRAPAGKEKALLGNFYCTQFRDAWAVAQHVSTNLNDLEERTRDFVASLQSSTLPGAVKDAATTNLGTLVSNTSFRIADGSFHGFEGCGDKAGLGFGTCTHVWNYEVATQFLFPALARSMREINFGYSTDAEGHMDFRHKLPLGFEHSGAAAADGQMGQIVKLYFDWKMLGDDAWLRRQWPAAKRALAYAWRPGGWDERKSGVMDGVQQNTYDVEFYGPNPMCGTWYLAALRAMEGMADAMGDQSLARDCHRMCAEGSRWIDANLFNGEFYIQKIRGIPREKIASGLQEGMGTKETMDPEFQLGDGCFIDQLTGQYLAAIAGLGNLLDPANIRKALASIYRYNLKKSLAHHASVQRVYALNDEPALVICDFTKCTPPRVPMPYYAETWTGLEYSVAALMMNYGMVDEGVELIRNVRKRYDGEKANPYDETEYGRHYARPMASWVAIVALSGFHYDARRGRMEILPKIAVGDFQCFWSTPGAWGNFACTPREFNLTPVVGRVKIRELLVGPAFRNFAGKLKVTSAVAEITHTSVAENNGVLVHFSSAIEVDSARPLRVHI
ncbi:MAG TPA: GH116 family glycosyl-hydrolase [Terracidiphilus sp.]